MYKKSQSREKNFTIETLESYFESKDFKELINQCSKHQKFIEDYQKIKWLNQIYQVGETIIIERPSIKSKKIQQVVKLNRIYCIYGFPDDQQLPSIEVQPYCGSKELNKKIQDEYGFSDYELFLTKDLDVFFIDVVVKKCQVLTFDEYEEQNKSSPDQYFSRAEYDRKTQRIEPPLDIWRRVCICNKPPNPDKAYILCETCEEWFHMDCVKITLEQAQEQGGYTCKKCVKQK